MRQPLLLAFVEESFLCHLSFFPKQKKTLGQEPAVISRVRSCVCCLCNALSVQGLGLKTEGLPRANSQVKEHLPSSPGNPHATESILGHP